MKKRVISAVIVSAILIAAIIGIRYLNSVNQYQKAVSDTTYDNEDAAQVPDGTYTGEYDVNFISAKVEVQVKQGNITTIELLEHNHDRGSAAEGIVQEIIRQQKVDVDAVSGATNSSTVIKKAVDNALSAGMTK